MENILKNPSAKTFTLYLGSYKEPRSCIDLSVNLMLLLTKKYSSRTRRFNTSDTKARYWAPF